MELPPGAPETAPLLLIPVMSGTMKTTAGAAPRRTRIWGPVSIYGVCRQLEERAATVSLLMTWYYVKDMGFTHGSLCRWQKAPLEVAHGVSGHRALCPGFPHGSPDDLKYLV